MHKSDVENNLKSFYDGEGWDSDKEGQSLDAQLWEDLRPCAKNYVSSCRRKLLDHLPENGAKFIDAASGPLQYPEYLEYSQGFEKRHCVDISQKALDIAKTRLGEKGEYHCASLLELPFPENTFDAGVSLHTIYHIDKNEQEKAVRELLRVMKSDKPLVIVYSNPKRLLARIKAFFKGQPAPEANIYFHAYELNWWQRFKDQAHVQILPWRSLTAKDGRTFIPNNFLGKLFYNLVLKFENIFPKLAVKWGAYPMIILKKSKKLVGVLVAMSLIGCAAPFKHGTPVEKQSVFLSSEYTQNGIRIDQNDLRRQLSDDPASHGAATASTAWFYTSMAFSIAGGYMLGYHLVAQEDPNSRQTGLLLAGGGIAISLIAATFSDRSLSEAVDQYNGTLKTKKSSFLNQVRPQFGALGTDGSVVPGLGFSLSL